MTIHYDPRAQARKELAALRKLAQLHNEPKALEERVGWLYFAAGMVGALCSVAAVVISLMGVV